MVYWVEPGGHWVGVGPGIQMIWPILKLLGSRPGLIARIACTVVLNWIAKLKRVSPALMVYWVEPGGHWVGVGPGIQMIWPILKLLGSRPGLTARIACTVVLNWIAKLKRVSPALMVYWVEPGGHWVGVTPCGIHKS